MPEGLVLKGVGGFYTVRADRRDFVCRPRGRLRREGLRPLPGDRVSITLTPEGTGRLDEILPRSNMWIRPAVANIDLLVIVGCEADPRSDLFLIDRMTVCAEMKRTEALILVNKVDVDPAESLYEIYRQAGYPCLRVSARSGAGVEDLRARLTGKTVAFAGHSGVGKSSLINALSPGFDLQVGEVSAKSGRGRHTTRHVELMPLSEDIWVADTPGFSAFDPETMEDYTAEELWTLFPEHTAVKEGCRFLDCGHIGVLGCAVEAAVVRGDIAKTRYESYKKLYEQAKAHDPYA